MDLSKPLQSQVTHNLTRGECRANGFSGIRRDEIGSCYEIWLLGACAKIIEDSTIAVRPNAMAEAYEELFMLHPGSVIP